MTDMFLYSGRISRGRDLEFIEKIASNKKSDKCTLILVTEGGDPDAAYKIGRYIQSSYDSFSVLVSGLCKSAGTLLAISAKELAFTSYGELGPLDVQMVKEDKILAMESGLNISEAFTALEDRAKDTYHKLIAEILTASGGAASIHTASHASSEMVSSLYGPIFARIDPEEVGSRSRAMRIGEDYTGRLNSKWKNLKENSISVLSRAYPSHSFVIDFMEASALFERVRMADASEMELVASLGHTARHPAKTLDIRHVQAYNDTEKNGEEHETGQDGGATTKARESRQHKANGGDSATPS